MKMVGFTKRMVVDIAIQMHLPNILSTLRIIGSVVLLFCSINDMSFWLVYCLCGISDMADGFLARKFNAVTKSGALLDSMADICFVLCCCWQLLPTLNLPLWLWGWGGIIAVIKVVNQISALRKNGKCCFPHTRANKVTGFLLFIAIPMTFMSIIPLTIVACVATYAAIEESPSEKDNFIEKRKYEP